MTSWDTTTYAEAVSGLRLRAAELADFPLRLHERAAGDDGAPRLSPAFLRHLTGSIHASHEVRVEVVCPIRHEQGRKCERCNDLGGWVATRDMYDRPLSRAIYRLAHAKSRLRPHPLILVVALIDAAFDLDRAAAKVGIIIASADQRRNEEARFLAAIRALHSRYEETVLGPRPGWTSLSESQQNAQDAA